MSKYISGFSKDIETYLNYREALGFSPRTTSMNPYGKAAY